MSFLQVLQLVLTIIVAALVIWGFLIERYKEYKLSKPEFDIRVLDWGSLVFGEAHRDMIKPSCHIRNFGFKVTVPLGRPPLLIERIEFFVWDETRKIQCNKPSRRDWVHLFPPEEEKENWDKIRNFSPGKSYPCYISTSLHMLL